MNEQLKAIYDNFYEEPPTPQLKTKIERCHRELVSLGAKLSK